MKRFLAFLLLATVASANSLPLAKWTNRAVNFSGGAVSIVQDYASPLKSTTTTGTGTASYSHTQGNLTYGAVFVGIAWSGTASVNTITYGGTTMTLLVSYAPYNTSNSAIYWLPLGTSSSGSKTVAVSFTASTSVDIGSVTYSGVHQAGGFGTYGYHNNATNSMGYGSFNTSASTDVVLVVGQDNPETGLTVTAFGSTTSFWTDKTLMQAGFGYAAGTGGTIGAGWTLSSNGTYVTAALVDITKGP